MKSLLNVLNTAPDHLIYPLAQKRSEGMFVMRLLGEVLIEGRDNAIEGWLEYAMVKWVSSVASTIPSQLARGASCRVPVGHQ